MTERFMTDDCGTLIDMHTRDTFDYVSDVVTLLNGLHEENTMLKLQVETKLFSRRELEKENEQLKVQLLYDGDGVCNICKHQYLVETGKYYVAKCEKEHEECSKVDLQYCEDFELVRDYE